MMNRLVRILINWNFGHTISSKNDQSKIFVSFTHISRKYFLVKAGFSGISKNLITFFCDHLLSALYPSGFCVTLVLIYHLISFILSSLNTTEIQQWGSYEKKYIFAHIKSWKNLIRCFPLCLSEGRIHLIYPAVHVGLWSPAQPHSLLRQQWRLMGFVALKWTILAEINFQKGQAGGRWSGGYFWDAILGLIEYRSGCWDPERWKEEYILDLSCGFMWPGFGLVVYTAGLTSMCFPNRQAALTSL